MRVKEKIIKSGYFWLPATPDNKIPGTLTIAEKGEMELEVVGLFNERFSGLPSHDDDDFRLGRIVGHIEEYGLITLEDCFYRKKNYSSSGISKSLVCVNLACLGVAYDEGEDVLLNTFTFSVEGIDEWVGLSGINVEYGGDCRTATITYAPVEDISFTLSNGMQLLIIFSWTLPGMPHATEAKITQSSMFRLVSETELPLKDFMSIAHKINTLLCFAVDKTVCVNQVSVTSESICRSAGQGEQVPVPISVYYSSLPYSKDEPEIKWSNMLFRYVQVQADAEQIINSWISAYDNIDAALNLYFSVKTGSYKYLEGKFLALAQGLETYHRKTSDETVMDEGAFADLVEAIIAQCPEENKGWLGGRLMHGNEINLGKRIKRIIDPFKAEIGTSAERGKVIRQIVDTRNYLTHYDEALRESAVSGRDLWVLCRKMESFFQLHLLHVLGFSEVKIKHLIDSNYQLKRKINDA